MSQDVDGRQIRTPISIIRNAFLEEIQQLRYCG
jgi:hypothetical protein